MVLSWLCPSASMSNSVRSSAGGPTWKGSSAGSPGLSSTVLLLLAKQESRLLGVSVLELLAEDSPLALLGDTNHQGSSRCRLAAGRGRGRNSNVLGLSSVGSCCAFHRLGVGGKTRLGSGSRGTSLGSLLGLGVFNTPIQNRQYKRRGKNTLDVTVKWFLQIFVYLAYTMQKHIQSRKPQKDSESTNCIFKIIAIWRYWKQNHYCIILLAICVKIIFTRNSCGLVISTNVQATSNYTASAFILKRKRKMAENLPAPSAPVKQLLEGHPLVGHPLTTSPLPLMAPSEGVRLCPLCWVWEETVTCVGVRDWLGSCLNLSIWTLTSGFVMAGKGALTVTGLTGIS